MHELRLHLFGMPQLEIAGQSVRIERRKAAALAAYLVLNTQAQSRDVLSTLLWPEGTHDQARAALRSTLSTLSKLSEVQWLDANRISIGIRHESIWVDVIEFRKALRMVNAHAHNDDELCEYCVAACIDATQLYRADFLHGFYLNDCPEFEEWQLQQRDWLRREYLEIQRHLSLHFTAQQQLDLAIKYAQQWLGCDPFQESAHRQLMRIYAARGQRGEVQRQYQQCVELLDEAFITPPEPETTELYDSLMQRISSQAEIGTRSSNPVISVAPPLPSLVIGREQSLHEIRQRLGANGGVMHPITVMHGWPGVGKSTTAAMLTHDKIIREQFPDGVLWASLGETPDVLGEVTGWSSALGLHDTSQTRKLEDISARMASLIRDRRMLLVVDDVWQVEHVQHFRIAGPQCATVMTSRLFDVALALAPTAADLYRLPVLTEDESLELLSRLTPETVNQYPDASRQLVKDLEGLPLAIHVAGRLLHTESTMGWGIRELLDELRTGVQLLESQPPSDVLVIGRDASPTVAALLSRSTDRLTPDMRRQFALLSLFVPKPATFDLEAMAVIWDIADPRPVVRHLVSHGLLEPVSGGRFQMHALLVMHAKSLLNAELGG